MKALLKINESFTICQDSLVSQNCEEFLKIFPHAVFYYHLHYLETDRFWLIDMPMGDKNQFIEATENFAQAMNFEIQPKHQTQIFLSRYNLANYK